MASPAFFLIISGHNKLNTFENLEILQIKLKRLRHASNDVQICTFDIPYPETTQDAMRPAPRKNKRHDIQKRKHQWD